MSRRLCEVPGSIHIATNLKGRVRNSTPLLNIARLLNGHSARCFRLMLDWSMSRGNFTILRLIERTQSFLINTYLGRRPVGFYARHLGHFIDIDSNRKGPRLRLMCQQSVREQEQEILVGSKVWIYGQPCGQCPAGCSNSPRVFHEYIRQGFTDYCAILAFSSRA
jgi:hypothetical protein